MRFNSKTLISILIVLLVALSSTRVLDDYVDAATLAFIEWPDLAERELDLATVRVRIAHAGGDHRTIEVTR